MSYGNSSNSEPSIKKLILVFGIIAVGVFVILSVFVFPIKNLIGGEITSEVNVINKNNGICIVDTSDRPRGISQCPYQIGDNIIVKYKEKTLDIISHNLKI
jgi:hypothetical protein